jgi:hypothetical protein
MSLHLTLGALLGVCLSLLLTAGAGAEDYGFRILRAQLVEREDGACFLDADIDYRFSEPAADALRNGVPLTLALHFKLKRDRAWWWGETVGNERWRFQIRYHPLSRLFQLYEDNSETPQNFASLNALLEQLGAVRGLSVAPAGRLLKGERYRASLSVALDIEALPLPLRPVAYLTPSWYLESPSYKWTFAD